MRVLANEELAEVSGAGWFEEIISAVEYWWYGVEQVITITAPRMTEAEANAYDIQQQVAALEAAGMANCTVAMTFQGDTVANNANGTVGATGPVPSANVSQGTTITQTGDSTTINCPPKP